MSSFCFRASFLPSMVTSSWLINLALLIGYIQLKRNANRSRGKMNLSPLFLFLCLIKHVEKTSVYRLHQLIKCTIDIQTYYLLLFFVFLLCIESHTHLLFLILQKKEKRISIIFSIAFGLREQLRISMQ